MLLADVLRAQTVILYRTGRIDDARVAYREAKRILEANANAWKTDADKSTWRHTPSNWRFVEVYGPFRRIRRTMLDDTGHNVVVHYRIGSSGWAVTLVSVYVSVDRDVPLSGEFEATKHEIMRQYSDAKPLRDGPKTIAGETGFETVLDLPPSKNGNLLIRIRASYPPAESQIRTGQVDTLIRTVMTQ